MTGKEEFTPSYSPLPSEPSPCYSNPYPYPNSNPYQNVVVLLPSYHTRFHRRRRRCIIYSAVIFFLLLLGAAVFLFYPSDPEIRLARIRLNHIAIRTSPAPVLDLSFSVTVRVRNRDFFSLSYDSLKVTLGYRGRRLGVVTSAAGGRIRARGSSYVDTTLTVDAFEVIYDAFYLLEDIARGVIPFDTDTRVKGKLGLFFFSIPLKATVSCEVYVNMSQQTIVHQNCYPESLGDPLDQNAYIGAGDT
ncbi:hypothetical protein RJT34_27070 [Clitoria ternatea]|uniref:Water stress and hypersensitive response domain-containing protein n=1 Tax=Clitoria ternatea TaxID=43366 RepID=A0AAN9FC72_CLITE